MNAVLETRPEVARFAVHRLDPGPRQLERVRTGRAYLWVMTKKPAVLAMDPAERRDFERRWLLAEAIKTDMRDAWAQHNRQLRPPHATMARPTSYAAIEGSDVLALGHGWWGFDDGGWRDSWLAQSMAFWEEYEEVNRRLIPDDPVYSITLAGVTASTAAVWAEYKPAATGQARVLESYFGGEQTSSTVQRNIFFVATTAGVTPTAYTPNKLNTMSAAAGGTSATAYTTQPVYPTNGVFLHAFNAFGGTDRWVPQPGEEVYVHGQGTVGEPGDWQPKAGASVMSFHGMVEEL
jgi:hypothetical protein